MNAVDLAAYFFRLQTRFARRSGGCHLALQIGHPVGRTLPDLTRRGIKRFGKCQVKMPGPVDPARLLVCERHAGEFENALGMIRMGWDNIE